MIFEDARLRLTLWYVLIVMVISLTFSAVVYFISFHEIVIYNNHQSLILHTNPAFNGLTAPYRIQDIENTRAQQLEDLKEHLIRNLALTNLIILILSALASYALAKRTLQPIEEMMEIQNRFTADASHELRTPLAAMQLEIEVALRDKKFNVKDAKDLLQSNLEEIEHLKDLSGNLLDLAQFKNSQNLQFNNFNLQEAISSALKKTEKLAYAKNIKIIVKTKDIAICGDKTQVTQLLTILLDNAIKYSAPAKRIWLDGEVHRKNITIIVKDEGIGIKKQDLPYIFNRFYQADQARTKGEGNGYGLGLAIAKEIVIRHRGSIEVESEISQGTTFTINLPLLR